MTEPLKRLRALAPEEGDVEALERVARGELSALGVLYDRHYAAVLCFLQRISRASSEAEDLAQETFLVASRAAGSFDGRPSCRPWLYGIASRLMMHRGRSGARLKRFLDRFATHEHEPLQVSPHDLVIRRQEQQELSRAIAKLSSDKRIVLLLNEVEGLSCEEIARSLEIPVGTVWTRLHHARRQLRKQLERSAP
jgi:RNA polymerase sigma-70 factor (ECF subfamily)